MITTAGIDFGNSNCVIAIPKPSGVEVVLNQSSNRLTPTMVTYSNERRYSGELSSQQQMIYAQSTITDLKRLVMLPYDSKERKKLSLPINLIGLEDGTTGIKIIYHDQEFILRPEQCVAYLLKELAALASKDSFVITVAPWWSERQRRAMINACKIADLKCVSLLNTTTAAAIAYTLLHRERLPKPNERSVSVAFVDIGGSAMSVAIASLKQQYIEIKSITHEERINGSKFTELFGKYLLEKVKHKYRINPSESPRSMLCFNQAVEKAKKILSVNPVVQFEVHSLMNVDVSFLVKREEFIDQIKDLISLLEAPINNALEFAGVKKESIFELQLLGGTTRVTAVKDELTRIFGKEPKKSLNLDECFAIGSAYMAAYLSPKMSVPIVVKDISPHSLTASWKDNTYNVFKMFNHVPAVKLFDVSVKNKLIMTLSNEVEDIGKVLINTGVNYETKVTMRIRLTQSCTIEVVDGVFEKDGKTSEANVSSFFYGDLKDKTINQFKQLEDMMNKEDQEEMKIDDAKNELESQILSISNDLNRNLLDFVDKSSKEIIEKEILRTQLWYEESEFDRFPFTEYQNRASKLKKLVAPIQKRMNQYNFMADELFPLRKRAQEILVNVESDISHQDDPRHDELLNDIIKYMQEISDIKEIPKYEDIEVNIEEMRSRLNKFQEIAASIQSG